MKNLIQVLKNSSKNLKSTLKSSKGTYSHEIPKTNHKFYEDINPIEQKSLDSKLEVLNKVNDYLRKKDSTVKQVTASFAGEQKSIEIIKLQKVSNDFHARTSALGKRYCYKIWNHMDLPPEMEGKVWYIPEKLDVKAMRK